MVAKITTPGNIYRALNYNEQKVAQGKATCLMASGFLKDVQDLNFYEKLARFQNLIALNGRAKTNTVHISLNFAESEHLPEEKLKQIAAIYMERLGFSEQPFLVYKHSDAGHPHLHIVTTNIQRDGSRISLHNLGKEASEKARKSLELQFGLTKAEDSKKQKILLEQGLLVQKAIYGKLPTIRAITNVLDAVLPHYKYSSLPELNAILRRYNVVADRGAEDGVIYRTWGLVYRILDETGNKVGIPVKASTIFNKPTLSFLEQRFKENEPLKERNKKHLQSAIDWVLIRPPKNLAAFEKELQKESISIVIRQNEEGFVYGLTYIDHRSKCVFNGSDLGKKYSAKGVMERLGVSQTPTQQNSIEEKPAQRQSSDRSQKAELAWNKEAALQILERILLPEQQDMGVPNELRKQKKKRREF